MMKGKKIIITGAASGIGKCLLEELSHYNCEILAVDMNPKFLDVRELPRHGGATIHRMIADLSDQNQITAVIDKAIQLFNFPDYYFANAGFAYYEYFEGSDFERTEKIFRVNVFAPLNSIGLLNKISDGRSFHFIITASAMAKTAMPGYALYASTKAALDRFADAYQFECPDHCKLSLVYPVATQTEFFATAGENVKVPWPSQKPKTVARKIILGVLKNKKKIYPSYLFRMMYFFGILNEMIFYPYQSYYSNKRQYGRQKDN